MTVNRFQFGSDPFASTSLASGEFAPTRIPFADSEQDAASAFERVLRSGRFAITAELAPPDSADPDEVAARARVFKGRVDAINATDASGARCHMSSVAVCALLRRLDIEPILQISCRDRNRIAIQGDVLGAAALGVHNALCLTGDGVQVGDHPQAKPVFDLDSISLLSTLRRMDERGEFLSGRKITTPPRLFLGAAVNPFAPPFGFRPLRLAKKVAAGARFVQTQYCYDIDRLQDYMRDVRELGLHHRVFILAGVGPLASARAARWMRDNIPGVVIPDSIIKRLACANDQRREGIEICIEQVQQIREINGISGVHFMAHRQEETVARIIERSGIAKRAALETPNGQSADDFAP